MIKAVIFDMDGVVVDSEPLYQMAEERLFSEYGVTIPQDDWKLFRGCTEARFYELAHQRYGITVPSEELRRKGRDYVLSAFEADLEYKSGFIELQRDLKGRYQLGLVTSTPEQIFDKMDEQIGIRDYFDDVITGGMTVNNKPHPEPYLEMMRRLNVAPVESVIIEDSISGLLSALASGAWTIAITGSVPIEDMPGAHRTIDSLTEISAPFLEELARSGQSP
ncbi:HAD family hydrolase [Candidatus Neomarinimicrobiota bacterium]